MKDDQAGRDAVEAFGLRGVVRFLPDSDFRYQVGYMTLGGIFWPEGSSKESWEEAFEKAGAPGRHIDGSLLIELLRQYRHSSSSISIPFSKRLVQVYTDELRKRKLIFVQIADGDGRVLEVQLAELGHQLLDALDGADFNLEGF